MIRNSKQRTTAVRKRDEALAEARDGDHETTLVYEEFAKRIDEEIVEYDSITSGFTRCFKI